MEASNNSMLTEDDTTRETVITRNPNAIEEEQPEGPLKDLTSVGEVLGHFNTQKVPSTKIPSTIFMPPPNNDPFASTRSDPIRFPPKSTVAPSKKGNKIDLEGEEAEESPVPAPSQSSVNSRMNLLKSQAGKKRHVKYVGNEHPINKKLAGGEQVGGEVAAAADDDDFNLPFALGGEFNFMEDRKSEDDPAAAAGENNTTLSSIQAREEALQRAIRERMKVIRKKDIKDSILMAVKDYAEEEEEKEAQGAAGVSEQLKENAKEIVQLRKANPETELHAYGSGIKFLDLPRVYNLKTIPTVWRLIKTTCHSSQHNVYLNVVLYTLKYLSAITPELKAAIYTDLARDPDLEIFAKYLLTQKSTSFHVSSLPGCKYKGDTRFNLLRLSELKLHLAQKLSGYLKAFCKTRKFNLQVHWNSNVEGDSFLLPSGASPLNSQQQSQQEDDDRPKKKMFFDDDNDDSNINNPSSSSQIIVEPEKSYVAKKLKESNFNLQLDHLSATRDLFYCSPRAPIWQGQQLQKFSETPFFPKDKKECLYFTPLR